jgi:hypothetical protein
MTEARQRRRLWRLIAADRYLRFGPVKESPRYQERTQLTDALHAAAGRDTPVEPTPLPEYDADSLDYDGFLEATDNLRRSIVVRGLNRQCRAVQLWTAEYLRERMGEHTFTILGGTPDPDQSPSDTRWDAERMTFAQFLDRMPLEPVYLNNDAIFVEACPELVDDLDLPLIRERFNDPRSSWDQLITTQVFVSSSLAHSALHSANSGNFFLQIRGRKTWTLVDPRYTLEVFPVPARPALYAVSHYGGWREVSPDHVLFRIPRYTTTLEPGDMLYNAPWWWHEVTNEGDLSIGCAMRHMPPPFRGSPSWRTQPQLTALSTYPLGRTLSYLHWALQRVLGLKRPLRDLLNPFLTRRVTKSQ